MHAPKQSAKRSMTVVEIITLACSVMALGTVVTIFVLQLRERNAMAKGVSNCRQIITAMRIYSSDHGGGYKDHEYTGKEIPIPKTANEALRVLFQEQVLDDETIFGCPYSPYVPDGKIGVDPDFRDALATGENHWMLTGGLSDSASGNIPIVYENAAVAKWNPKWNANAKQKPVPGRTWTKGIIIGLNDSSVAFKPLAATQGSEVPLKDFSEGKNLFTQHMGDFEVLDVARKPE